MESFAPSPSGTEPARTRWVQQTLNRIDNAGLAVDGVWGRQTDSALRSFQAHQGTSPSGILGPTTLRAIERQGGTIPPAFLSSEGEASAPDQRCRIDTKNRRYVCGTVEAEERRAPLKNADEGLLKDVPPRLCYYQRRERLLPDTLQAYERMYDALRKEMPALPAPMLKLISGYRGYNSQAALFKTGLLTEFNQSSPCDTVPPGRLAWLIDRTNDAFRNATPNPADRRIWPNKFFQIAAASNVGFSCGVQGAKERINKRRLVIAPPTSNSHQAGCSIDVWLGSGASSRNRDQQIRTPAFKWMVANAKRFGFHPYVAEPWHWEFIKDSATEPGGLAGIWGALLRPSGEVQSETGLEQPRPAASGIAGLFGQLGSIGTGIADAAFSSAEKLWLSAHIQSSGIRDRGKLTDAVFNRRHPDRQGRRIARNEPDARTLVAEWQAIGEKVVAPVLAYLSQQQGASVSPGRSASAPATAIQLGSLPLYNNGRPAGRYQFTPEDLEWLAKMVVWESGGGSTPDDRAVVQCVINRYAVTFHRRFKSFAAFLRTFSTTLQPVLINSGAARRHMNSPQFERTGGFYANAPDVPRGQLKRHLEVQRKSWADLPPKARAVATDALTGTLVNPGIGNADNFASTKIYFKQKFGRNPSAQEWRAFTEAIGKTKGRWIGDVPGLDQTKNAFFLSNEASQIGEAIRVTR